MKKKRFDCVQLQRDAHEARQQRIEQFSEEQLLEYFAQLREELLRLQEKQKHSTSTSPNSEAHRLFHACAAGGYRQDNRVVGRIQYGARMHTKAFALSGLLQPVGRVSDNPPCDCSGWFQR